MGLSRTISEIDGDFSRKLQYFPTPLHFASPLKGFSLELGTSAGGQKTRMMGLLSRQRNLTISSALWIQCTNVTDGRDRQTDTGQQQRPRLCIASRSKKALHCWFGNSLKRHTLASDPISMTLDLLNPKSIGFNM